MPTVTLRFRLPEDVDDLRLAQQGARLAVAVYDFDMWLRSMIKYGAEPINKDGLVDAELVREKLHEMLIEVEAQIE